MQFLNEEAPIEPSPYGVVMLVIPEAAKALAPTVRTVLGKTMDDAMAEQFSKAESPMEINASPRVREVMFEQPLKAELPICVTVFGIVTKPDIPVQSLKAEAPISVKVLYMIRLANPEQPSKADAPMVATAVPIRKLPNRLEQ